MKKLNVNKEQVSKIVKGGCGLAIGIVTVLSNCLTKQNIATIKYWTGNVGYIDTVNAIMDSWMTDSTKTQLVTTIKQDAGADYYKSVIKVIQSWMTDSSKLQTIKALTEK